MITQYCTGTYANSITLKNKLTRYITKNYTYKIQLKLYMSALYTSLNINHTKNNAIRKIEFQNTNPLHQNHSDPV